MPGRDKFASQSYTYAPMTQYELEAAYRGDWIARKVIDIPAFDMTREWRSWQADEAQVELSKSRRELIRSAESAAGADQVAAVRWCLLIMGVDNGAPEEELDPESVIKDSLKFLHVVSMINVSLGRSS